MARNKIASVLAVAACVLAYGTPVPAQAAGAKAQTAPPARSQTSGAYCGPKLYAVYPLPRPFGPALSQTPCRAYTVDAPAATLNLAVALTAADRARGLMDVRSLPPNTGMLFAFPDGDQTRSFWMKDTLVPLDMVFVAADGRINEIFENVPSSTFETPEDKVAQRHGSGKYVIELRAGDAKHAGLRVGLHLALPTLGAEVT